MGTVELFGNFHFLILSLFSDLCDELNVVTSYLKII